MENETKPPPRLSLVDLKFFSDFGYVIVPDVFDEVSCRQLTWVAQTLKSASFAPLMQPHRKNPFFHKALRIARVVGIAEQLCGGRVSGLQSVWYYGAPHTPGFNAHQDNYFVEAPRDTFVSAWSPMQDIAPEMGGIVGYPGSHKFGTLLVQMVNRSMSENQDPNAILKEVVLPEGCSGVDLVIPKGAVLFMHQNFIHESRANTTEKFRRALLLTYIRSGESFRPGNTAKRTEVNVYGH